MMIDINVLHLGGGFGLLGPFNYKCMVWHLFMILLLLFLATKGSVGLFLDRINTIMGSLFSISINLYTCIH